MAPAHAAEADRNAATSTAEIATANINPAIEKRIRRIRIASPAQAASINSANQFRALFRSSGLAGSHHVLTSVTATRPCTIRSCS